MPKAKKLAKNNTLNPSMGFDNIRLSRITTKGKTSSMMPVLKLSRLNKKNAVAKVINKNTAKLTMIIFDILYLGTIAIPKYRNKKRKHVLCKFFFRTNCLLKSIQKKFEPRIMRF